MWFKKLFNTCDHRYKYFFKEVAPRGNSSVYFQYKFLFICKNCDKVVSITEDDILEVYAEFSKDVAKQRAKGCLQETRCSNFLFPRYGNCDILLTGVSCTRLLNHYEKYNLKQIELSHRKSKSCHAEGECSCCKGHKEGNKDDD